MADQPPVPPPTPSPSPAPGPAATPAADAAGGKSSSMLIVAAAAGCAFILLIVVVIVAFMYLGGGGSLSDPASKPDQTTAEKCAQSKVLFDAQKDAIQTAFFMDATLRHIAEEEEELQWLADKTEAE